MNNIQNRYFGDVYLDVFPTTAALAVARKSAI